MTGLRLVPDERRIDEAATVHVAPPVAERGFPTARLEAWAGVPIGTAR